MLRPATESALASIAAVTRASVDCCTWASSAPGRSVPPRPRLPRALMKRRRVSGVISIRNQHTGVRGLNRFKNALDGVASWSYPVIEHVQNRCHVDGSIEFGSGLGASRCLVQMDGP